MASSVQRVCPHCGAAYPVLEPRCPRCGRSPDAVPAPTRSQLPALLARAAVPIAVGVVGLAARAGVAILRGLLERALLPASPPETTAAPHGRPRVTIHFWQRRDVWDASGRHSREEVQGRWEVHEE